MQKSDRRSQCGSNFLSKTNRQFYMRRKKSPEEIQNFQIGKVLKTLIKRKQKYCYAKPKHEILLTEKSEQVKAYLNNVTNNYTYLKSQDKFFQLAEAKKNLQTNLKKVNVGLSRMLKSFEKCLTSESIQQMQFNQLDFYETFNQVILIQLQKGKVNNINQQNNNKNKYNDNSLLLQNIRLEKENNILRMRIGMNQNSKQFCKKQLEKQQVNKLPNVRDQNGKCTGRMSKGEEDFLGKNIVMEKMIQTKIQEIQIMRRDLQNCKEQIYLLRDEKKSLKERINQLKTNNQNLCSQIINIQLKNKKTGVPDDQKQAIRMMQAEQILSYQCEVAELKKLYLNINKKYKGVVIKLKKTTNDNSNKLGAMFNRQMQMFPQQFQAFQEIRGKVHNSNRLHLNQYNKEKKLDKSVIYQQFLGIKDTMNNKQGIKKCYSLGMQYFHPSFYGLIAQDIDFFGMDQTNFEHFNQNIKLTFMGTLRAIMDSKFNQFVLKKRQNVSSFPAFVLGWLHSFQINQSKQIEAVSSSISTREAVCGFYANLMSEKLNYSWEIVAFRQFLLETFNNDELYFYLSLRNFIIGGDISFDISYSFEEIYYVEYNKALIAMNKVIGEKQVQFRKVYDEFLKRAIVYIRKKSYIDLHYVLRILLEYYMSVKQKQIDRILKTIEMIVQGKKNSISFIDFQRIFDFHFDFISKTEIVQLYRKCFCVGNGQVNADVVITILIQQSVFLKWVDSYFPNSLLELQQIPNADFDVNYVITPGFPWLYDNERKFRFLSNTQLQRVGVETGIQSFQMNVKRNSKLNCDSLLERVELLFDSCMLVTRKFFFAGIFKLEDLQNIVEPIIDFLLPLSNQTLRKSEIKKIMRGIKYKASSGKIVRFYQKKRAEMTRSLLYAYSSNVVKNEQQQKVSILRGQFMQLIEVAKQKKNSQSRKNLDEI